MEWWTSQQAGWIGGIAGGSLGLVGAVFGSTFGILAARGKGRALFLGVAIAATAISAVILAVGVAAVVFRQPYHVWYPCVLAGGIGTLVFGMMIGMVAVRFAQADRRKLAAEELRRRGA